MPGRPGSPARADCRMAHRPGWELLEGVDAAQERSVGLPGDVDLGVGELDAADLAARLEGFLPRAKVGALVLCPSNLSACRSTALTAEVRSGRLETPGPSAIGGQACAALGGGRPPRRLLSRSGDATDKSAPRQGSQQRPRGSRMAPACAQLPRDRGRRHVLALHTLAGVDHRAQDHQPAIWKRLGPCHLETLALLLRHGRQCGFIGWVDGGWARRAGRRW